MSKNNIKAKIMVVLLGSLTIMEHYFGGGYLQN